MKMNTNARRPLPSLLYAPFFENRRIARKRGARTKEREKRDAMETRVADTRNIVTSLSWLTFNFQAGNVVVPQPHTTTALYSHRIGTRYTHLPPPLSLFTATNATGRTPGVPPIYMCIYTYIYKQTRTVVWPCPRDRHPPGGVQPRENMLCWIYAVCAQQTAKLVCAQFETSWKNGIRI